ncbi:NAD(P)-binding protein [Cylindrobasidium torrendii FP15055 ss-10]|uniref:NAD(P)-binding protein n=1 Tax=Cylindrobasidium torrendii FP15055 ss-10 TaxID=1314674 RepID=A0A0D7B6X5_9AGAR|nr:NAD(P)-binding protein [Cylindrobasidium torrendii FP15055 ss-10]
MSSTKPLVLVVGATGYTGKVVTKALLDSGEYRVAILVREKSQQKPAVQEYKAAGAEVRIGDITQTEEELVQHLAGVNIIISLVLALIDQKPLFRAAKKVSTITRVVPSDFGPHGTRGVTYMQDIKLDVREFIKELGLPYTFIEVGWWIVNMFPYAHAIPESLLAQKNYVGDQQTKQIISTFSTIGSLTPKVVNDPRTLNQTVLIHDGEMTTAEGYELGSKITGEDFSDYKRIPDETVLEDTKSDNIMVKIYAEYRNSLYIRGDNVLSKAFAQGVLDARALYPDAPVIDRTAEAKEFYAHPHIAEYDF